jgi:hypothetical protein
VHDSLAVTLAERLVKGVAVVPGKVVACEGLSAVLVDALEDLYNIVRRYSVHIAEGYTL